MADVAGSSKGTGKATCGSSGWRGVIDDGGFEE
jgi:hypothetical protein